jgi:hypothetical protein
MAENRDVKIIGGLNKEFASLNLNDWGARQKLRIQFFDVVVNNNSSCFWHRPLPEDSMPWSR